MSKNIRSTKPVAFHVTRDQYERLRAECAARGDRSVAELVRAKVMRAVTGNSLAPMARKLDRLEQAVHRLSEALSPKSMGAPHGR